MYLRRRVAILVNGYMFASVFFGLLFLYHIIAYRPLRSAQTRAANSSRILNDDILKWTMAAAVALELLLALLLGVIAVKSL